MDDFPEAVYSYDEQVRQYPEYKVLLRIVHDQVQSCTSQQEGDASIRRASDQPPPPLVSLDAVVEQLVALTRQAATPTSPPSLSAWALRDHVWRTACSMAFLVRETEGVDMQRRLVDFVFKIEAVEVRVGGGGEDGAEGKVVLGGLDMYSGPVWTKLPFLNYNFLDDLLREAPPLDLLPERSIQWENQAVFMGLYNNSLLARYQCRFQTKGQRISANQAEPATIDPNMILPLPYRYSYFIDSHLAVLDTAFADPWKPQTARNIARHPNGLPRGPTGCAIRAACLFTIYGGVALWEYTVMAQARKAEEDDFDGDRGGSGSGDENDESENEDEAEEGFELEPVQDERVPIVMARWARWKQEFRIARVMYDGDQLDRTLDLIEQTLEEMDRLDGGHGS